MSKNMYMDLHVVQTVPPSCVNRDDTGSPKTAMYGGTMRARVSSQAWKHAMRSMFQDLFPAQQNGYRTKKSEKLVAEKILKDHSEIDAEKAEKMAMEVLKLAGVKSDSDKKDVLFFISANQVAALAELAIEYDALSKDEKKKQSKSFEKKIKDALKDNPSIDILLFGRMAASDPSLNYDAAAQVAHSISTHTVSNEYDYFTAVDDCSEEDNAGAGHLGTVEFNSSTLYRYATVNISELAKHLTNDELKLAIRGFAEAFIRSMPTGKQNTFANRTLPDMVYVTLRKDQPVNLAGAFERPVYAGNEGYVKKSKEALFNYAEKIYAEYVTEPMKSWIIGEDAEQLGAEKVNLKELLQNLEMATEECLSDGE